MGIDAKPKRAGKPKEPLSKQLGLLDVYAISTGAMFSSGFFLLPGLASAEAGPAVALAYLIAGITVIPAMLSVAELSTAMPKAGGPYYFLDRSIGPLMGTVGGVGTWLALVFKSAFALVGMSAYLALFFDLPIQPVAAGLAAAFMVVNIVGVKKTANLQVVLVGLLIGVLTYFIVVGMLDIWQAGARDTISTQFAPFFPFGVESLISTVGLVFVSYAGLTQVSSVAEEVRQPTRNIPLGMFLSLLTATVVYVLGVAIMVAVLDPGELREDLTPVATAVMSFGPQPLGLILVVGAAIAAFASTGNAGLLSAARYPLAMARDRLVWRRFAKLGRFDTPTSAVLVTGGVTIAVILLLDVEGIAKLASAFMLLIFGLMNLAVIVMRESRIEAYDPGFRSPLYPWTQLAGIGVTVVLVIEIGVLSIVFTLALLIGCVAWFFLYARSRVARDGAIYHVFARLGRRRDSGLDQELFGILQEQGLRDEDRFAEVVARAIVIELDDRTSSYEEIVRQASEVLAERLGGDALDLAARFSQGTHFGATPTSQGVAMPHLLLSGIERPEMVIVRARDGVVVRIEERADDPEAPEVEPPRIATAEPVSALFFLAGDEARAGRLLRILGQLAMHIDDEQFQSRWLRATNEQELKEVLLQEERMLSLYLREGTPSDALIRAPLRDLNLPEGCLVALIRRDGRTIVPRGSTVLRAGDRITLIGDPPEIQAMADRYGGGGTPARQRS